MKLFQDGSQEGGSLYSILRRAWKEESIPDDRSRLTCLKVKEETRRRGLMKTSSPRGRITMFSFLLKKNLLYGCLHTGERLVWCLKIYKNTLNKNSHMNSYTFFLFHVRVKCRRESRSFEN